MRRTTDAIIIGAGQAGLAMSHCLARYGVEHVVLERGRIAERWRSERWDSLRLLTPNWMSRLPGWSYRGPDPDGFMTMPEVVALPGWLCARLRRAGGDRHRGAGRAPRSPAAIAVETSRGAWRARAVVIATGPLRRPGGARPWRAPCPAPSGSSRPRLPQPRRSCRQAACWSSAPRPPACSSPRRSSAPAVR